MRLLLRRRCINRTLRPHGEPEATSRVHDSVRSKAIYQMAVRNYWSAFSIANRSRVGIRMPRWQHDGIFVWRRRNEAGRIWLGSPANTNSEGTKQVRQKKPNPLGLLRHARQRGGMVH